MLLFIFLKTSSVKIPPKADLQVLFMRKRFFFFVTVFASSVNVSAAHKLHLHSTTLKIVVWRHRFSDYSTLGDVNAQTVFKENL